MAVVETMVFYEAFASLRKRNHKRSAPGGKVAAFLLCSVGAARAVHAPAPFPMVYAPP